MYARARARAHTHTHTRTHARTTRTRTHARTHTRTYTAAHATARANPNKSHAHSLYLRGGQGLSQHVVQFQRDSSCQVAVGPSGVGVVVPFGPVIIISNIKFIIIISNNNNLAIGQIA